MTDNSYYQQRELWEFEPDASATAVRDVVLEMIPAEACSILDTGCGNGAITNYLPADRRVVACDVSAEAMRQVKFPTCIADLKALPFRDGEFDLVLATDVLEHVRDASYSQVLEELYRVSARWLLIAVPYRELLDVASVDCANCETRFHVHWHQRSYSAKDLSRLWEGRAAVSQYKYCGARWKWSSPEVVSLMHLCKGRVYDFAHAICPSCGAQYLPTSPIEADRIDAKLEALHYTLGLVGRIPWPTRSEMVMLFDKEDLQGREPQEDVSLPPPLLSSVATTELDVVRDPDNYATEIRQLDCQKYSLLLPRLPKRMRCSSSVGPVIYDPLLRQDVPLLEVSNGWFEFPRVCASRYGYLLRFNTQVKPHAIEFEGETDPIITWAAPHSFPTMSLLQPLIDKLEFAEHQRAAGDERISSLLKLSEDLENRRALAESQIHNLLNKSSALEADRAAGEIRVAELLELSNNLEQHRAAAESRIQELLLLMADIENKRAEAENKIANFMKT